MQLVIFNRYVEAQNYQKYEVDALRTILTIKNPKAKHAKGKAAEFVKDEYYFLDDELRFLRGLLPYVEEKLREQSIEIEVVSKLSENKEKIVVSSDILPNATLRDYQCMACEVAFYEKRGVVQVATGGGKTIICAGLNKAIELKYPQSKTITFVNKQKLMKQTVAAYKRYGLKNVGWIGKGEFNPSQHTVVMIQTAVRLVKRGELDWAEGVKLVNWDETHHLGADTWSMLARALDPEWSIGYSGTPFREGYANFIDPSDIQMLGITGGVIVQVPASYLIKRGLLAKPYIFMVPVNTTDQLRPKGKDEWNGVEKTWIVDNGVRNDLIVKLTKSLIDRGLNPLIIVSKIRHGEILVRRLGIKKLDPVFSSGGPKITTFDLATNDIFTEADEEVGEDGELRAVQGFISGKFSVLIGSSVFDEGVDLPAVTAVINAAGGKSFIKNLQRIGRGLRPKPGDNSAYIFDFIDKGHVWLRKHSRDRIADYSTEEEYEIYEGWKPSVEFFDEEWYK